jgi:hypothetical protein
MSLLTAVETAIKVNQGYTSELRAVSIFPRVENDQITAEVTLLVGSNLNKVKQNLD